MNNQAEATKPKQANTGKIGFILSLFILPVLFLYSLFHMLTLVWFLLLCISLILCIHGLIKKRSRELAVTGLFINIIVVILIFFVFITMTPHGSIPYPLNIYKFKRVCPKATFWLDFDKTNLEEVKSGMAFLSPYASLNFQRNSEQYSKDKIIEFAEENGWKYYLSISITPENIHIFDNNNQDLSSEELEFQAHLFLCNPILVHFREGDTLLIFKTTHCLEYPSFVLLSKNSNELIIHYKYPVLPDPGEDLLPELFYKLSEENNKEIQ